ncbi:MAG: hypothetical protein ACI81P_003607, partial [Neolewinella sp.]
NRWIHFLLFLGAFILLLAAGQQLFLYFTDWHAADDEHSWWHLGFGLAYLLVGGVLAYSGYRYKYAVRGPADRYVRISDDDLTWSMAQKLDEKKIALADIATVERLNVRDLKLTLKDGNTVLLPIYLVTNEAKQEELMDVLGTLS